MKNTHITVFNDNMRFCALMRDFGVIYQMSVAEVTQHRLEAQTCYTHILNRGTIGDYDFICLLRSGIHRAICFILAIYDLRHSIQFIQVTYLCNQLRNHPDCVDKAVLMRLFALLCPREFSYDDNNDLYDSLMSANSIIAVQEKAYYIDACMERDEFLHTLFQQKRVFPYLLCLLYIHRSQYVLARH